MKKILVFLFFVLLSMPVRADERIEKTTTTYRHGTSSLVQRGDARVYRLNFIATANNGDFMVLDSLTDTTVSSGSITDVKAEGKQATSGNMITLDYTNDPLELSTGLYLVVNNGYLTITYD